MLDFECRRRAPQGWAAAGHSTWPEPKRPIGAAKQSGLQQPLVLVLRSRSWRRICCSCLSRKSRRSLISINWPAVGNARSATATWVMQWPNQVIWGSLRTRSFDFIDSTKTISADAALLPKAGVCPLGCGTIRPHMKERSFSAPRTSMA